MRRLDNADASAIDGIAGSESAPTSVVRVSAVSGTLMSPSDTFPFFKSFPPDFLWPPSLSGTPSGSPPAMRYVAHSHTGAAAGRLAGLSPQIGLHTAMGGRLSHSDAAHPTRTWDDGHSGGAASQAMNPYDASDSGGHHCKRPPEPKGMHTLISRDAELVPPDNVFEFSALHNAMRRIFADFEGLQPQRRLDGRLHRQMAEEVMRRIGMSCGVGTGGFSISTKSAALSSRESLAWFGENEHRLKAGDWPRRPATTTAASAGSLIQDVVQRWVAIPVTRAQSLTSPPTVPELRYDDYAKAAPLAAQAASIITATGAESHTIFTFGDAAWLQRIAALAGTHCQLHAGGRGDSLALPLAVSVPLAA